MTRIREIRLRCFDPAGQKQFYCDVLGMRERQDGTIGYEAEEAGLRFELAARPYRASRNDLYWKVALSVPNIELACRQLTERGVQVGSPRQFHDVGFLAHFEDPEGYTVELLDHWLEGERPAGDVDTRRLGGGAHLSLLTLRSCDIDQVQRTVSAMGMTPLSIVPVPGLGFELHFYGSASEPPPSSDLHALENRTWVYRRPFTVLEVLHRSPPEPISHPVGGDAGYGGAVLSGLEPSFRDEHLWLSSTPRQWVPD